jgi:Asp-tRNA(Asn)/Glu-tRNA(Gln) amidotransferase C subunit
MALSKEERCRELARLVGIPLMEAEAAEVAERFESLIRELERLTELDLVHIQPVLVFPEEEPDGPAPTQWRQGPTALRRRRRGEETSS